MASRKQFTKSIIWARERPLRTISLKRVRAMIWFERVCGPSKSLLRVREDLVDEAFPCGLPFSSSRSLPVVIFS
jgi:hypothetical protein